MNGAERRSPESVWRRSRLRSLRCSSALAAIGVYGSVRFAAGRRMREVAIRLAVGAAPFEVVYLVMRRVLLVSVAAVAAGAAGAAAAGTALQGLLHAVDGRDVPTLTAAAALCLCGAAVAAGVPALRAARVDPSVLFQDHAVR